MSPEPPEKVTVLSDDNVISWISDNGIVISDAITDYPVAVFSPGKRIGKPDAQSSAYIIRSYSNDGIMSEPYLLSSDKESFITEPSFSAVSAEGTVSVGIKVKNADVKEGMPVGLYTALYREGALCSISGIKQIVPYTGSENSYTAMKSVLNVPDDTEGYEIKAFVWGDGGGGPTRKMLEYYRRLKYGLPGVPKVVIESAKNYLDKLENDFIINAEKYRKIPRWVGELYLEFHRGTYTSVAKNKKNNRYCEFLMQTAEQLSSVGKVLCGMDYPQKEINQNWKMILLNQFHDIIPGSSIKEVYEETDIQYEEIKRMGETIIDNALSVITAGVDREKGWVVYNPNSFETDGYAEINGKTAYVGKIPALGWKTVKEVDYNNNISVADNRIENRYYIIDFDNNYNICSLYDKRNERQVIKNGCVANQLEAFEDIPYQFDNWELCTYYKQKKWNINDVSGFEIISDGARAGYKITRKFLDSEIIQKIYLYDNSPRIDFATQIEWKQEHIVVKVAFPVDIHSDKVVYETQFGYVQRANHENTPWDAAKFEVCAHKYADICEDDYGVAILNDCKYGHSAEGSTLKLTFLKCGTDPWRDADKGKHEFIYSLLPHFGNHKQGGVIQEAYKLNRPFIISPAKGEGNIPDLFSLIECNKSNVIIETVKKAENSDAVVIRAYDAYNRKGSVEFKFGFDINEAFMCDFMENKLNKLEVLDNRTVKLNISTFEIITIMVM